MYKADSLMDTASKMIYQYPQSLVSTNFAALTVTSHKIESSRNFVELSPTLNKTTESSPKQDTRFQRTQAPLIYPTFFSPLMEGHVSGLPASKSPPLAKINKHRFFHDTLIAERGTSILCVCVCVCVFFFSSFVFSIVIYIYV